MTKMVAGARTMLAADPAITALLGSDDVWDTWLWQDSVLAPVEGTSKVGLVVVRGTGSHATPNRHNTMRFPRLTCVFWGDPDRDLSGNVTEENAADKIEAVYAKVDRRLHRPQGGSVWWGGVRVLDSVRQGEIEYTAVPDGDGLTRGSITYAVTLG